MTKETTASLTSEQAVLGAMMLDAKAVPEVVDILSTDDFASDAHQAIYRAILSLDREGFAPDAVTVSEELERQRADDQADLAYVGRLVKDTPSAANVRSYARVVRDRAIQRRLAIAGHEIRETASEPGDPHQMLEEAQSKIMDVGGDSMSSGPKPVFDAFGPWVDQLDQRLSSGGGLIGASTGVKDLDKAIGGLAAPDLVVLAARPGMGKTSLAMSVCESACTDEEHPGTTLMFSMEMSRQQLLHRMVAKMAKIDGERLRLAEDLEEEEWHRITAASYKLRNMPLWVDDSSGLTVNEMRARARRLSFRKRINLIAVDYIQLMREPRAESRTQEITEITRGLKGIAKDMGVPVLALSQLNRDVERRDNKRPRMSDLRESGSIEQDADIIGFLYRHDYYYPDEAMPGVAEVEIAKHRQGPESRQLLHFNPSLQLWGDLDPEAKNEYRFSMEENERGRKKGGAPVFSFQSRYSKGKGK